MSRIVYFMQNPIQASDGFHLRAADAVEVEKFFNRIKKQMRGGGFLQKKLPPTRIDDVANMLYGAFEGRMPMTIATRICQLDVLAHFGLTASSNGFLSELNQPISTETHAHAYSYFKSFDKFSNQLTHAYKLNDLMERVKKNREIMEEMISAYHALPNIDQRVFAAYTCFDPDLKEMLRQDLEKLPLSERISQLQNLKNIFGQKQMYGSALQLENDYPEYLSYKDRVAELEKKEVKGISSEVKVHVNRLPTNISATELEAIELHEQEISDELRRRERALARLDNILLDSMNLETKEDVKNLMACFETIDERNFIYSTLIRRGLLDDTGNPRKVS